MHSQLRDLKIRVSRGVAKMSAIAYVVVRKKTR
jgi:hypothetical protein